MLIALIALALTLCASQSLASFGSPMGSPARAALRSPMGRVAHAPGPPARWALPVSTGIQFAYEAVASDLVLVGSDVRQWLDSSGNGNHTELQDYVPSYSARPAWTGTELDFSYPSGNGHALSSLHGFSDGDDITIYMVVKGTWGGGAQTILDAGGNAGGSVPPYPGTGVQFTRHRSGVYWAAEGNPESYGCQAGGGVFLGPCAATMGSWTLLTYVIRGTGALIVEQDGVQIGSTAAPGVTLEGQTGWTIGNSFDGANGLQGQLKYVAVCNSAHGSTDRATNNASIKSHFGL